MLQMCLPFSQQYHSKPGEQSHLLVLLLKVPLKHVCAQGNCTDVSPLAKLHFVLHCSLVFGAGQHNSLSLFLTPPPQVSVHPVHLSHMVVSQI